MCVVSRQSHSFVYLYLSVKKDPGSMSKPIGPNSQRRFVDKPSFVSTNLLLLFTNQVCKKRVKTRHMTYINLGLSTNLLCEFGPITFT